jgi:(p)ppGpp synthase/HD superfamily hydrolase
MPTLEDAIALAVEKHRGQKDRAGAPYILHPLRVMARVATDAERMAAVLHDVVEDSDVTVEDLRRAGYPEQVVAAVDRLSKREGEGYEAFIERIAGDALAVRVKLADLEDNMDLRRMPEVGEKDWERYRRYLRAWRRLALG